MADFGVAAKSYVPQAQNPLETLSNLERYRILQNQNTLSGLEARQKGIDVNSLADWKTTGSPNSLMGATPTLRNAAIEGDTANEAIKKDVMSRDAHMVMNEKDPAMRKYLWNKLGERYVRDNWIPADVWQQFKDKPNDQVLDNIIRGNMGVAANREMTGQTTQQQAAAGAPYKPIVTEPGQTVQYPGVRAGAPTTPIGVVGPATGPSFEERWPATRPPGTMNMTDLHARVVPDDTPIGTTVIEDRTGMPEQPPAVAPPPKVGSSANPYSKEVPEFTVGTPQPTGRGIVQPGMDPALREARKQALPKIEEIGKTAEDASKTAASLGTMRSGLESGRVTTDKLADVKGAVAGLMNAFHADPSMIKATTGLDPANQEVFNKESTRMGLTYARQTEGAREAFAGIQIALAANPGILNTVEGNKTIIKIMEEGAKHDIEKAKAANAYYDKNKHMTGFEQWWSEKHPAGQFVSRAIPYQYHGPQEAQSGITYEFMKGGKRMKGVWNSERHGFEDVH